MHEAGTNCSNASHRAQILPILISACASHHVQVGEQALGAAIAALGLSNKAVFSEDGRDASAGDRPGAEFYSEGPEIAPNSAPSAVTGAVALPGASNVRQSQALAVNYNRTRSINQPYTWL